LHHRLHGPLEHSITRFITKQHHFTPSTITSIFAFTDFTSPEGYPAMCSTDVFLGVLAVLFPPLPGSSPRTFQPATPDCPVISSRLQSEWNFKGISRRPAS
jgi:hypothetical protein